MKKQTIISLLLFFLLLPVMSAMQKDNSPSNKVLYENSTNFMIALGDNVYLDSEFNIHSISSYIKSNNAGTFVLYAPSGIYYFNDSDYILSGDNLSLELEDSAYIFRFYGSIYYLKYIESSGEREEYIYDPPGKLRLIKKGEESIFFDYNGNKLSAIYSLTNNFYSFKKEFNYQDERLVSIEAKLATEETIYQKNISYWDNQVIIEDSDSRQSFLILSNKLLLVSEFKIPKPEDSDLSFLEGLEYEEFEDYYEITLRETFREPAQWARDSLSEAISLINSSFKIVIGENAQASDNIAAIDIAGEFGISETILDSQADINENIIVIGGPAVNSKSAELLGLDYPTYGLDSGIPEGKGLIGVFNNNGNTQILIAGWDAIDTRVAARVLVRHEEFVGSLNKNPVVISGSLDEPIVE